MPTLTTIIAFNNGAESEGPLLLDASGDLLGSAAGFTSGLVFESLKTAHGYAIPFLLPNSAMIPGLLDSAGGLFGVATGGGADSDGVVVEIANTAQGYASTQITLSTFDGADGKKPNGPLIMDSAGNLFGTTEGLGTGQPAYFGSVFEVAKTAEGYASSPTPLFTFGGLGSPNGDDPNGPLVMDAAGDLFGATAEGGEGGNGFGFGTVFEIAKTAGGYASTPTILVDFDGGDGSAPGGLIMDGAGNLFGTSGGGQFNDGTVFEIPKTASGYASTPITLATFDGTDGSGALGGLIMDAAGDLFGYAQGGGTGGLTPGFLAGTVFEIAKVAGGYDSTPIVLFNFNPTGSSTTDPTGFQPGGGLTADAAGDLFGSTMLGGPNGDGTVYEITDSGFVAASHDLIGVGKSDLLIENTSGAVAVGQVVGGEAQYTQLAALGPEWKFEGTGALLGDGDQGVLIENSSGDVVVGEAASPHTVYTLVAGLGSEWSFHGTGDFLGDGEDDFLIENTAGAVVVGEVVSGQAQYTTVAGLGPEWSFQGVGDFLGDGKSDFLIENTAGAVVVGEVVSGQARYTTVTGLGHEWKFVGTGDFLSDGKDDFLIENSAGAVVVGEVANGQAQYTQIAALGPEWKFVGAGDYLGEGHDQFLIENAAGAVDVGDWINGQIHFTQVTALGPEWAFH